MTAARKTGGRYRPPVSGCNDHRPIGRLVLVARAAPSLEVFEVRSGAGTVGVVGGANESGAGVGELVIDRVTVHEGDGASLVEVGREVDPLQAGVGQDHEGVAVVAAGIGAHVVFFGEDEGVGAVLDLIQ